MRDWVHHPNWERAFDERRATCHDCIQARGITAIYKDSLKCCTFFPFLPNFVVGQILESDLPGRVWLEQRVDRQGWPPSSQTPTHTQMHQPQSIRHAHFEAVVVPLGLGPSVQYQQRFKKGQPEAYGNDVSLLCPHYVAASGLSSGLCGIWKHRPSPCMTFFCESSFHIAGIEFWRRFEKWYSFVELSLAREALLHLGLTEAEIALSLSFLPNYGAPDSHVPSGEKLVAAEQKAWMEFGASRKEFYLKCWGVVSAITREDFHALLGEQGRVLEAELQTHFPLRP